MKYVHLPQAYFKDVEKNYIVQGVETVDEAKELISKRFDYVTDVDGIKLFRKPERV